VWLAEGGRRIVKLLRAGADAEVLRRQFAFVRRLDLGGLHVAKPIAVLKKPYVGYVAEFLGDMVPIKSLMEAPSKDLVRWHIDTGSLRRRLRCWRTPGKRCSACTREGVVYADVSHNNVFVSEPVERRRGMAHRPRQPELRLRPAPRHLHTRLRGARGGRRNAAAARRSPTRGPSPSSRGTPSPCTTRSSATS
jgi:hypothetical protein